MNMEMEHPEMEVRLDNGSDSDSDDYSDGLSDTVCGLDIFPISDIFNYRARTSLDRVFIQLEYSNFLKFVDNAINTLGFDMDTLGYSNNISLVINESQSRYLDIEEYRARKAEYINELLFHGDAFLYRLERDTPKVEFRVFMIPIWRRRYHDQLFKDLMVHVYYNLIPVVATMIEKFD
jgi:hypothetical protein